MKKKKKKIVKIQKCFFFSVICKNCKATLYTEGMFNLESILELSASNERGVERNKCTRNNRKEKKGKREA